jgi:D-alanyl-lipoteichoic acid acyltransferase DltB (MBOAT superfamily)
MTFASPEFIILFFSVLILYYCFPHRFRNALLLVASAVFYMWWRPEYILVILFSVTVDYFIAFGLERTGGVVRRRLLLVTSLVTNLGLLFFFKYFEFSSDSLRSLLGLFHVHWEPSIAKLILPIGISFHTFQALSYTIDVYRGEKSVERSLGKLWLYVLFFPQLVAGPIERAGHLLPQFDQVHAPDPEGISNGMKRILWGLIKKVAIADRLAVIADAVYDHPANASGTQILVATYAFAFQIYADFSGYSDIAIGAAQTLGFRLRENFDRPYFAPSPSEFWRRWHMSLSSWFRDYVYFPMGGSRAGELRGFIAVLITFTLSGLWHGARWTFVVWGAYHGMLWILSRAARRRRPPELLPSWVRATATFHLVLVGWVLFRASSFTDAWYVLTHAFSGSVVGSGILQERSLYKWSDLLLSLLGIVALLIADWKPTVKFPAFCRWIAYVAGALLVLNGRPFVNLPFIYFQF